MVESFGKKIPLEISVVDDASDPNQNVDVYVGAAGSDLHAAAAAIAEKNKIPYLGIGFAPLSIHEQGYKYLFSPFPKSPSMAKQEAQSRGGYSVPVDAQYAPGATDYTNIILQAQQANVDAILAVPSPPDGLALFKQLKELDVNAKLYNFIRASDNSSWIQALGPDGNYYIFCTGWSTDVKFPAPRTPARSGSSARTWPSTGPAGW